MLCVNTRIVEIMKKWLKKRKKSGDDEEYVYMKWQYKKSYSEEILKNDCNTLETENLKKLSEYSEFADVESWLERQDTADNCLEIYCDCCDAMEYDNNHTYHPLTRSESGTSVEESDQSQHSLQYSDQSQHSLQYSGQSQDILQNSNQSYILEDCDQLYYSLQLRKKSSIIFKSSIC